MFSIGCRFNDRVTGEIKKFAPNAKIVHIDIESAAISRNVTVDIPIVADAKAAILKILEHTEPMKHEEWIAEVKGWDKEYPLHMEVEEGVNPQSIIETLNEVYADRDTVFTSDVGQHQMWASQYLKLDATHRLVQSGGLGTMGFGLPSAVGAQIGCPEKSVVSISGDGGFQMNMQELATAVCQELPLVNIVFNNNRLGMVRQMQELFFKKRYTITCLRYHKSCKGKCGTPGWVCPEYVPDFVKMAEAYGSKGYFVTSNDQLKDTILEAREYAEKNKKPVIVECMVAPDELVMPMIKGGASFEDIML
jgi:acetolactate synthase-1/2/3 large subunit